MRHLAVAALIVWGLLVPRVPAVATLAAQSRGPAAVEGPQPVTYFIADGRAETGFQPGDRDLARWALDAWQRSAAPALRLAPAPEETARVRVYWVEAGDGQYGEMQPLIVDGQRGAAVFIRPDVAALGPDLARRIGADPLLRDTIVYLTCLHELGHAFGLGHTSAFADIMYFFGYGGDIAEFFGRYRTHLRSRSDIPSLSGLSDEDVRRIRALYVTP